jgi:hypothetical protein
VYYERYYTSRNRGPCSDHTLAIQLLQP